MMKLNEKTFEIEINDLFSYESNVKYIIDNIKNELKDYINTNYYLWNENKEWCDKAFKFIGYQIVDNDKIDILKEIIHYQNNTENATSIFNEGDIENCIYLWVEKKFVFDPRLW